MGIVVRKIKRTPKGYVGTKITSRHMAHFLPVVLQKIERRCGMRPGLLIAAWPEVIGQELAHMTEATSFGKGILYVKVKNSTLYGLLVQESRDSLLQKLKKKFPNIVIKDIKFFQGA